MLLKVAGLDPSLRNFGLAKGQFDITTSALTMRGIDTIRTENESGKTVRKSSDDLRCASLLHGGAQAWIADAAAVFAEVPSGSQSARGSFSNGVCLGVLAGLGAKLIQVNPLEVKRAAVGSKNASKEEMVEWAVEKFPELPWIIAKSGKFKGKPSVDQNEHMADACAAINAGVQTDEFKSLVRMLASLSSSQKLGVSVE